MMRAARAAGRIRRARRYREAAPVALAPSGTGAPQNETGRLCGRSIRAHRDERRAARRMRYLSVTGTLKYFFAKPSIVPSAFRSFSA